MSTFQDLEREVAKLRRQVRKLKGDPTAENDAAVRELVGAAETDQRLMPARRSLGAELDRLAAQKARQNVLRAKDALHSNARAWERKGLDGGEIESQLMNIVRGLTAGQAREACIEFFGPQPQVEEPTTGEHDYGTFERSRR